jgi:hypothetical protein
MAVQTYIVQVEDLGEYCNATAYAVTNVRVDGAGTSCAVIEARALARTAVIAQDSEAWEAASAALACAMPELEDS